MKYTTKDLSQILNVSTNTIRRYEEKGFLKAVRNESNGYREFDNTDVERLMYTNKYRRVGFSLEEISDIFHGDIDYRRSQFVKKMSELDMEIEHLKAIRHMVKDDLELLKRINDFSDEIKPFSSSPMHYILYQKNGNVSLGEKQAAAIHEFLDTCPEYEYIYYFEKEAAKNEEFIYSEGIAANEKMVKKYAVCINELVKFYESRLCIMKVIRVPHDLYDTGLMSKEELKYTFFGQFNEYMKENDLVLAGDVIGIKLGLSFEDGNEWQYVLMHMPVIEK